MLSNGGRNTFQLRGVPLYSRRVRDCSTSDPRLACACCSSEVSLNGPKLAHWLTSCSTDATGATAVPELASLSVTSCRLSTPGTDDDNDGADGAGRSPHHRATPRLITSSNTMRARISMAAIVGQPASPTPV